MMCFQVVRDMDTVSSRCRFRGCNLHPTRWQTGGYPRAPLTYTLAPHVPLQGGLQMIAPTAVRSEFNGILACFPDGAT